MRKQRKTLKWKTGSKTLRSQRRKRQQRKTRPGTKNGNEMVWVHADMKCTLLMVRLDERWLDWLDSKVALLVNRDGVDPRAYGGKNYDELGFIFYRSFDMVLMICYSELSKAVEPFMKQEDEGKYRCKTCQKLFKATSYVEKHIANKHPELVKYLDEVM